MVTQASSAPDTPTYGAESNLHADSDKMERRSVLIDARDRPRAHVAARGCLCFDDGGYLASASALVRPVARARSVDQCAALKTQGGDDIVPGAQIKGALQPRQLRPTNSRLSLQRTTALLTSLLWRDCSSVKIRRRMATAEA